MVSDRVRRKEGDLYGAHTVYVKRARPNVVTPFPAFSLPLSLSVCQHTLSFTTLSLSSTLSLHAIPSIHPPRSLQTASHSSGVYFAVCPTLETPQSHPRAMARPRLRKSAAASCQQPASQPASRLELALTGTPPHNSHDIHLSALGPPTPKLEYIRCLPATRALPWSTR